MSKTIMRNRLDFKLDNTIEDGMLYWDTHVLCFKCNQRMLDYLNSKFRLIEEDEKGVTWATATMMTK